MKLTPLLLLLPSLGFALSSAANDQGVLAELPFFEAFQGSGGSFHDHVPIDLSPDPEESFVMLLDTGAQFSVMTPRYARRMHITVRRHKQDPYRKKTVLGRDLQFYVDTSSSTTASRTGMEAGLIGGNFLEEYVTEVDYEKRTVRFLDARKWKVSEKKAEKGEIVVPIRFTNRRPMIEIELGSGSAWFLMDTGAPMDLTVSQERADKLGIELPTDAQIRRGINLYGTDRTAVFLLPSARVDDHELQNVELGIAISEGSSYRITNVAGPDEAILGNAFLSRFRVRFDYPHRKVSLLPR